MEAFVSVFVDFKTKGIVIKMRTVDLSLLTKKKNQIEDKYTL